jgi:hypothetical protein
MRGNQLGRVQVTIQVNQNSYVIWSFGSLNQGDAWQFASVGYYADEDHHVSINPIIKC